MRYRMEQLFCIQNYLLAGLIEVLYLNFLVGKIDIAVLVGGEGLSRTSNIIAVLIIIIVTVTGCFTISWWYFAIVLVMFIIVGISNIFLYPILKKIGSILWSLFAPSHYVLSENYEIKRGQICGCRWLALVYAIVGGVFTLYHFYK